jgi:NADH-quinone oxidoreductase subunit G
MPKLTVDGIEVEVAPGMTVLQACEAAGAEIPRFCYHERLSIAGNCRMCLVEMEKSPKPIASCAMPAGDGMVIHTKTETVKKAREGVMEFLLINHPLDCPICDQGGECDLQDQAMAYGIDKSRYAENKRAVEDKYIGPLVKTIMTRCIHCTRCVRFATEVGGVEELGATGRGEDMEITTYLEAAMSSELSGNVIDLCPVGALTSRPYAFSARSWELRKTESICVMDAIGCQIRVDTRGREVMRVMPRVNDDINEEWISDKSRFIWDGLKTQRLDRPYLRKSGKLEPVSWEQAFAAIAKAASGLKPAQMAAISGDLAGAEEIFALKKLTDKLAINSRDCRPEGSIMGKLGGRAGYLFNSTLAGLELCDALLLIGSNPRHEAAVLNARIRKLWRAGLAPIGVIGERADLTYEYDYLGAGPETLKDLAGGKSAFADKLKAAKRPAMILGESVFMRPDSEAVLALALSVAEASGMLPDKTNDGWNGFNVLHSAAGRVAGLDLGFLPRARGRDTAGILDGAEAGRTKLVYLLGADEIATDRLAKPFVVYQGSHGDKGAHVADVILPGAAYTEKSALYANTEGRVQATRRAAFPAGDAREDWAILRALSDVLGHTLEFNSLAELRAQLAAEHKAYDYAADFEPADGGALKKLASARGRIGKAPFVPLIDGFYLTNPIARASGVMAQCDRLAKGGESPRTGTDG